MPFSLVDPPKPGNTSSHYHWSAYSRLLLLVAGLRGTRPEPDFWSIGTASYLIGVILEILSVFRSNRTIFLDMVASNMD